MGVVKSDGAAREAGRASDPGGDGMMGSIAAIDEQSIGPIVGVALHAAHRVSSDLAPMLALDEPTRLREEDPYTELWACAGDVRVIALRSRFEVDLNRSRDRSVYAGPEHAWGLSVWHEPPPDHVVERAHTLHDRFYHRLRILLDDLAQRFGHFVVLDVHSYNHRRGGPAAAPEDPKANPEVNVGTGSMEREFWAPIVDCFVETLSRQNFFGRTLDVRENVRFKGGYLPRWVHANYPRVGCALALEFKKFYMDEWTGRADPDVVTEVGRVLLHATSAVRACLRRM